MKHSLASVVHVHELHLTRGQRTGCYVLGLIMALLGGLAIVASVATTFFSVFFVGMVLLISGIVQMIHGFMMRQWKGLFLSLLIGVLYSVTGVLCLFHPAMTAAICTILIGMYLVVGGLFRMIFTAALRFKQWGWFFVNGLIAVLLGGLIMSQWPESSLWTIGLFVGVDLSLGGWSLVFLSFASPVKS